MLVFRQRGSRLLGLRDERARNTAVFATDGDGERSSPATRAPKVLQRCSMFAFARCGTRRRN